jgi:hypothetical protein
VKPAFGEPFKAGILLEYETHISMKPSPFPLSSREVVTFLISLVFGTPHPDVFQELPQDRHPERSASRISCLTEGLQRVVEGPRGCLLADALHSFPATKTMREIKKSQPPSEAEGSAIPRTFPGNVSLIFQQNCHLACPACRGTGAKRSGEICGLGLSPEQS